MSKLAFRTYGFASLPSGTYLFFPLPRPDAARSASPSYEDLEGEKEPQRVMVSTVYGARWDTSFSGVAGGETLFIDVEPDIFDMLHRSLRKPARDFRQDPATFEFALDDEEGLTSLEMDGRRIDFIDRRKSGPAPARETA